MDIQVSEVLPKDAVAVWHELQPMIDRALTHGAGDCTTSAHLLAAVLVGQMSLWVVHEGPEIVAGLVVSVQTHPAKRTLFVELCAGRHLDLWADRIESLLKDCREITGVDTIEACCRVGLARRLAKRGWKRKAVLMQL